jgi:cell fate regulator YaaT (PSP1 superfamily)
MSQILAVRIPLGNRLHFFRSGPCVVKVGDYVLAEVDGELHMGKVERASPEPESGPEPEPVSNPLPEQDRPEAGMPTIFRPATGEDLVRDQENRELARKAFGLCRQFIQERSLEMKLVDVVVLFDGSKILFFFTATNRIDFRELVKDLVRVFRTRIELRQIGARHETQMVGGIGNCGQLICCQRFLRQFAPSTIKMAKEQNLFLNPAKISGVCNRLLCCLSFEQGNYEEFLAQCPKVGKKFSTALGPAKILRANYFRRTLSVWLESGGEREIDLDEWFKILTPGELMPPARPAAQMQPLVLGLPGSQSPPKSETAPEQPVHSAPKVQAPQASPTASFQGKGSDRGEKSAVEARQAKDAGEKDPGKKKRKGRSGSRKSKRRSRPSRG